jgi:hypothetical protein
MTVHESISFFGRPVPRGSHLCAFFSGPAERDKIIMPFLADGIRAGHKCICIAESLSPDEVLDRLGSHVDLGWAVQTGQLELGTPADSYLRSGRFHADDMLSYWGEAATAASDGGFGLVRAMGEMPSAMDNPEGRAAWLRYEARVNSIIADLPEVVLCLYDLRGSGAKMLMDTLRTHPMMVADGTVRENPYYIDPGKFLRAWE